MTCYSFWDYVARAQGEMRWPLARLDQLVLGVSHECAVYRGPVRDPGGKKCVYTIETLSSESSVHKLAEAHGQFQNTFPRELLSLMKRVPGRTDGTSKLRKQKIRF